jgi:hypothetical protein
MKLWELVHWAIADRSLPLEIILQRRAVSKLYRIVRDLDPDDRVMVRLMAAGPLAEVLSEPTAAQPFRKRLTVLARVLDIPFAEN